jgi:hypothetical protein
MMLSGRPVKSCEIHYRQAEFIGKIRLLGGKLPASLLTSAAFLKI